MDEALWLPTQKAVRVALRTQQIIAYRVGRRRIRSIRWRVPISSNISPMRSKKAQRITSSKIDDMGGALQAIEKGFMQNEIQNAAYAAQQAIERGEQVIVGVNQFKVQEELTLERLKVDPAIELGQKAKLKELRERRDQKLAGVLLEKLKVAASGTENLMPLFIECVENDITLGEICNTLRVVWGEYVAEGF